jgi:predicted phosphatase
MYITVTVHVSRSGNVLTFYKPIPEDTALHLLSEITLLQYIAYRLADHKPFEEQLKLSSLRFVFIQQAEMTEWRK